MRRRPSTSLRSTAPACRRRRIGLAAVTIRRSFDAWKAYREDGHAIREPSPGRQVPCPRARREDRAVCCVRMGRGESGPEVAVAREETDGSQEVEGRQSMTRAEFFRARAVMRFELEHGVTRVPPAVIPAPVCTARRKQQRNSGGLMSSVAQRMSIHPRSEGGQPVPISHRKLRRASEH